MPASHYKATMAQIQLQMPATGKKGRAGKALPHIDMTPLVDLAFLLITFFIFATTITEKKGLDLVMPKESGEATPLSASHALTIVLEGSDRVKLFSGIQQEAEANHEVVTCGYDEQSGIGKYIRERQRLLGNKRQDLMLIIRPTKEATYKNVVDALDEATINNVQKYAIAER
jgi:biopolymer transport protein ExbD